MTLDMAKVGDTVKIIEIIDHGAATVAMRLGISQGETLSLVAKIPGGPLVVNRGDMEIALGREICKGIEVQVL
jgi:Fe2+ transport system protein FeoA